MNYLLWIAQLQGQHECVQEVRRETSDTSALWCGTLDNLTFHQITVVFNLCFGAY